MLSAFLSATQGCGATPQNGRHATEPEPCQFSNPIAEGQDPWVIKKDGIYYYIESRGGGIYVSKSKTLTEMKANQKSVWSQPETGWNSNHLWAPELFFLGGKWYIYYAAGRSGPPFIHQRSGVLESVTDDPQGEYIDKGKLYTGDDIESGKNNKWSIDLTVFEKDDQLYAVWSGWVENRETDKTPQHLYIAEMENPWTISSNRVKISSPVESWETGTELAINEGPQILENDRQIFIIYSASESWLPAYNLGQLRLKEDSDPMNPDSWVKEGSVFSGTDEVYGVGHASFTASPDNTENWIVYHAKVNPEPGWERVIHMQPFGWNDDGSPDFGIPMPAGETARKPSGECD